MRAGEPFGAESAEIVPAPTVEIYSALCPHGDGDLPIETVEGAVKNAVSALYLHHERDELRDQVLDASRTEEVSGGIRSPITVLWHGLAWLVDLSTYLSAVTVPRRCSTRDDPTLPRSTEDGARGGSVEELPSDSDATHEVRLRAGDVQ